MRRLKRLSKQQRTRLANYLEKAAVGVLVAVFVSADATNVGRLQGIIGSAGMILVAVWLDRPVQRRP